MYCGGSGAVSHKFFWLAEALPENNQSNRVAFKAKSADPNWDITSGADVLNVRWLGRVDADTYPRKSEPGAEQTIALARCCLRRSLGLRMKRQTGVTSRGATSRTTSGCASTSANRSRSGT